MVDIIRADLNFLPHAEALISLMSEYALDPMGGGKELSDHVKTNLASTLNERCGVHVVLAYLNNEAVGLVTCIEGFSTFTCKPLLNIHDAVVKADCRGQGIISALLAEAENIAKENDCCKLTLEVLEGNKPARSAYSRFGFNGFELDPKMGKAQFWEKKLL